MSSMRMMISNLKNLNKAFHKSIDVIINTLYPTECLKCQDKTVSTAGNSAYLCQTCRDNLVSKNVCRCSFCGAYLPDQSLAYDTDCQICRQLDHGIIGLISISRYEPSTCLAELILRLKHSNQTYIGNTLGYLLSEKIQKLGLQNSINVVTAVPLHYTRLIKRGYNQADLIAEACAKGLNYDFYPWILRRKIRTKPQSGSPFKRKRNVENAFHNRAFLRNASVLLVDDVFTTGSTTIECARCLLEGGADHVLIGTCAWVPMGIYQNKGN